MTLAHRQKPRRTPAHSDAPALPQISAKQARNVAEAGGLKLGRRRLQRLRGHLEAAMKDSRLKRQEVEARDAIPACLVTPLKLNRGRPPRQLGWQSGAALMVNIRARSAWFDATGTWPPWALRQDDAARRRHPFAAFLQGFLDAAGLRLRAESANKLYHQLAKQKGPYRPADLLRRLR